MKRRLDSGPVTSTFHYDEMEDKSIIHVEQDCEPIVERNKALQNETDGYNLDRDLKHIASIPLVIVQKWMQEDGVNFLALSKHERSKYLRRKLADPDNRFLRTSPGVY